MSESRPSRPALIAVVGLAVLARLAALLPRLDAEPDDPDNYLPLARNLATGLGYTWDGHPTAYRPPLYPLLLAPMVAALGPRWPWGVYALHLTLGAGTTALVAATARRWGLSPTRALVAAAVVALDPVLVIQARSVMTETLTAFLLAATLWALADPREGRGMALGGFGFGLAALCRPSTLPAAVLTAGAVLVAGPGDVRLRLRRAGLLAATAALTLAPWAIRNAVCLGAPIVTTTHGGYTLALANNPTYYAEVLDGPPGAVWTGRDQYLWFDRMNRGAAGMSEPEADRYFAALGWRMLRERPRDFARASLARLGRFWGVMPAEKVYPRPYRLALAAWTVPLWAAVALGLARRSAWRRPRVAAPLMPIALTAVHALYWTDLRMRAPIMPALALIAALAGRPGDFRATRPADVMRGEK